jgi:hypothetical protein
MARVTIHGITQERYMMENGLEDKDMATEYGRVSKEIATLENGGMVRLLDMVYSLGVTETSMKVSGT